MLKNLIVALVIGLFVGILVVVFGSVLKIDLGSMSSFAFVGAIAGLTSVIVIDALKKKQRK